MPVNSTEFDVINVFEWDKKRMLSVNVRCEGCRSTISITQKSTLRNDERHIILFVEPHECHRIVELNRPENPNIIMIGFNEDSIEFTNGWRELYKCKLCSNSFGGLVNHKCTDPNLIL